MVVWASANESLTWEPSVRLWMTAKARVVPCILLPQHRILHTADACQLGPHLLEHMFPDHLGKSQDLLLLQGLQKERQFNDSRGLSLSWKASDCVNVKAGARSINWRLSQLEISREEEVRWRIKIQRLGVGESCNYPPGSGWYNYVSQPICIGIITSWNEAQWLASVSGPILPVLGSLSWV